MNAKGLEKKNSQRSRSLPLISSPILTIALLVLISLVSFTLYKLVKKEQIDTRSDPLSDRQLSLQYFTSSSDVTCLAVLPDRVLAGTGGGLLEFNSQQSTFRKYFFSGGPAIPEISCILEDPHGRIWIGTDAGLAKLGKETCAYEKKVNWPVINLAYHSRKIWVQGENMRVTVIDPELNSNKALESETLDSVPTIFFFVDEGGAPPDRRRLLGYDCKRGTWNVLSKSLPEGTMRKPLYFKSRLWAPFWDQRGDKISYYGLYCLDNGSWITSSPTFENQIAQDSEWLVLYTDGANLFGASSDGVFQTRGDEWTFYGYPDQFNLMPGSVQTLSGSDNSMWLGTSRGIGFFDGYEWYFNSFVDSLPSNRIEEIIAAAKPWLVVTTPSSVSLYNHSTDTWTWSQSQKSKYAVVTQRGLQPELFKLEKRGNLYQFYKLSGFDSFPPEVWPWQELTAPPVFTGDIEHFHGDNTGNLWLYENNRLWRFASGRWFHYQIELKETYTHKMIMVEEAKFTDIHSEQLKTAVVERIEVSEHHTWFSVRGRGWKAVVSFYAERWNSILIKERYSTDFGLISADDEGVWLQEQSTLYYNNSEGQTRKWKTNGSDLVRINDLVEYMGKIIFSISGLKGAIPYYDITMLDDEVITNLNDTPPVDIWSPVNSIAPLDSDLWLGTSQGIVVVRDLFPSVRNKAPANQKKRFITSSDITLASVGEPVNIKGTRNPALLPSLSPDMSKLAYMHSHHKKEIYILDMITGESSPLLMDTTLELAYKPSFSPDGEKLLFYAEFRSDEELFLYEFSTDTLRRLSRSKGKDWDPSLNASGDVMVFTSNRWGNNDIFIMPMKTLKATRLTANSESEWHPDISPDGTSIVYVKSDRTNPGDLWIMNADGSEQRPLVSNPGKDWLPSWSPDGKYIAFTSHAGGFHHIQIIDWQSKKQLTITGGPYNDYAPTWSFDGQELVFHSDRSGTKDIWRIQVR